MCRRPIEALVRSVDQMEHNPIVRGRGRPGRIIGQTVKRDLR